DELADAHLLGRLGPVARRVRGRPRLRGRAWARGRAGFAVGHSGGSSLNTRRQITSESRCAATVASAPVAASKPAQISRLKISLSIALPSSPGIALPGILRGVNQLGALPVGLRDGALRIGRP